MKNLNELYDSSKEENPALAAIIKAILENTNSLEFIATNMEIVAEAARKDMKKRIVGIRGVDPLLSRKSK